MQMNNALLRAPDPPRDNPWLGAPAVRGGRENQTRLSDRSSIGIWPKRHASIGQETIKYPAWGAPAGQGTLSGPVRLIRRISEAWHLTDDEFQTVMGYSEPRFAKDLMSGLRLLEAGDQEDRVRLLWMIHDTLADLFVDPEDESRWLRGPLDAFKGQSPLAFMMSRRIPGMIEVRAFVEHRLANR